MLFPSPGLIGQLYRDGTLLTQRFHFAQIPHPYRHVLGWYRLIKELEHFGVEAICVFDGKERNLAKAQEVNIPCLQLDVLFIIWAGE